MRPGPSFLILAALVATGCTLAEAPTAARDAEAYLAAARHDGAPLLGARNFAAHLTGDEEVPPVSTRAQGQVTLKLSDDGTSMSYRLNVANIRDVTMAHLHLGAAGTNGPVVVWLYPPDGPPAALIPGRSQGTLAAGSFTADDLIGPLAGLTLGDLVHAIREGRVYANVHTSANPGGEVRGQLP